MTRTMKAAAPVEAPSFTVTLEAIDPLCGTMLLGGYTAEIVVRRVDGKPMTAHDRKQATWLLSESEKREASDEEVDDQARAILAAEKAKKSRTKTTRQPAARAAAKVVRAPAKRRAS